MKIIKIGAVWCNGCLVMRPRFLEIEKENPELETIYYDFDESPKIREKYKIESGVLPVFIFINKNGAEIARMSGEVEKSKLMDFIRTHKND